MIDRATTTRPARRAFTIVELLVVVGIIAVLIGVLLAAFGGARRSAERSTAERFLGVIGQAVEQFKGDLGYYPPLLAHEEAGVRLGDDPPGTGRQTTIVPEALFAENPSGLLQRLREVRFGSEFTLAVYLLGTGNITGSEPADNIAGSNSNDDDGHAGPGFRSPGPDRSWGGAAGRAAQLNNRTAIKTGRVYGPYIDPAGLANHLRLDRRTGLFRMIDLWGQPIRYYTGWPTRAPGAPAAPSVDYTPVELRTADSVRSQIDGEPHLELDRPVFNAPFMLLSAGKPLLFQTGDADRSGLPLPLFGDRRRDGADLSRLESMPSVQSLSTPFDPGALPAAVQEQLLEDLGSNVRHIP